MAKQDSFSKKQGVTTKQTSKVMRCMATRDAFQHIKTVETAPISSGRTFLLKHLKNGRLTRDQAIKAKCCDCMGYHIDGRIDCEIPDCPLYPYMPYRKKSTTTGRIAAARGGKTRGE